MWSSGAGAHLLQDSTCKHEQAITDSGKICSVEIRTVVIWQNVSFYANTFMYHASTHLQNSKWCTKFSVYFAFGIYNLSSTLYEFLYYSAFNKYTGATMFTNYFLSEQSMSENTPY